MKDSTRTALQNYAEQRIKTGDFLYAVLTNNLFLAMRLADSENLAVLQEICKYVWNEMPSGCWGTPEKVKEWLAEPQLKSNNELIPMQS